MRSAHSHILGFTKFDRYLSFQILKAVVAVTLGFCARFNVCISRGAIRCGTRIPINRNSHFRSLIYTKKVGRSSNIFNFYGLLNRSWRTGGEWRNSSCPAHRCFPMELYVGILPVITTLVLASFFLSEFATPDPTLLHKSTKCLIKAKKTLP